MLQGEHAKKLGDWHAPFRPECETPCEACACLHSWQVEGTSRRRCVLCGRYGAWYFFSLAGWAGYFLTPGSRVTRSL